MKNNRQANMREEAEKLSAFLKDSEYTLIDAVARTNVMTIKEAGKLVAMQRKLRAIRCEIEVKARIW